MKASIQKWGNSLALRIPALLAKEISVREGDAVELSVKSNCLVVRSAAPAYDLRQLIQRIDRNNLHNETDWGPARGQEVW